MHNHYSSKICVLLLLCLFRAVCRANQLTPKYIHVKISDDNQQSKNTKLAATKYRVNQEIKFLYKNKQVRNERMYKAHLECAKTWDSM